jgi:hypothetical protein
LVGLVDDRIRPAVHGQRQRGGEEEADGDHVRRVVVEVQVLVAGVGHPVEVTEDAVGEAVAPGAHQHGADHHQRDVGEDGHAEGHGHVQPHAQLAADLDLAQHPRDKGADGTHGDDLPDAAFAQRCHVPRPYFRSGGAMLICQMFQVGPECGAPQDQRDADEGEEDRGDTEEADVERPDPEVEQVPPTRVPPRTRYFLSKLSMAISSPPVRAAALRTPRDAIAWVGRPGQRPGPAGPLGRAVTA